MRVVCQRYLFKLSKCHRVISSASLFVGGGIFATYAPTARHLASRQRAAATGLGNREVAIRVHTRRVFVVTNLHLRTIRRTISS